MTAFLTLRPTSGVVESSDEFYPTEEELVSSYEVEDQPAEKDDGGCGCSTPGSNRTVPFGVVLMLLAFALRKRYA